MPNNDERIKKLSDEIKGTLRVLFEAGPVGVPGVPGEDVDPLGANVPGMDPLAMGAEGGVDPMADPMAMGGEPPMGMDDLNGGTPGETQDPNDPLSVMGTDKPVSDVDQGNLNAIPQAPVGEVEREKVAPEPNVDILGNEAEDQEKISIPNFVMEAFGGSENAQKVIDYLVERVVMKYKEYPGKTYPGNTTHGEQNLHDVIVDKLAAYLEKKEEDDEKSELEFRKDLAGVDKKTKDLQEENLQIKEKYISFLKEFGEVLTETHTYLRRNELNWNVFSLAISDERKAQAVREMSSMSLAESERYLKQLQKLEESAAPAARPRKYNTADSQKLREFVRQSANRQDAERPKKDSSSAQLYERVLRNAGIPVEEEL